MLNDEKRGVEEAYTAAGNSSDLRVEADLRGDADLIIAAGWSESRVGMALLRLHSEWDKAEKPRKPAPETVKALAASLLITRRPAYVINPERMEDHLNHMRLVWCQEEARRQAQNWYMREMAKLVNKLKSLPEVRRELTAYVPKWGIQEAALKVPVVIAYWLDQTCHHCQGLKFLRVQGAPVLSTKACRACAGTGIAPVPHGQEGRRVANYMDECLQKGRDSIRRNLSAYREPSKHKRSAKGAGHAV
jgi:hypothetical protein